MAPPRPALLGALLAAAVADDASPSLRRDAAAAGQAAVDPQCAIAGFWEITPNIVARVWKVRHDLGGYQHVGRGRCTDAGGRVFAGWSGAAVAVATCKETCDASDGCVGFEYLQSGACAVLYNVDELPEGSPAAGFGSLIEGDDAQGDVAATTVPWDHVCYKRAASPDVATPEASLSPGYWRIMFYPRSGGWSLGDDRATREAHLNVTDLRPKDNPSCDPVAMQLDGPFLQGVTVWWGTEELTLWAGVPSPRPSTLSWLQLDDEAAWDISHRIGGNTCPMAKDITGLTGQQYGVQHAVWGLRSCHTGAFRRLAPESAPFTEEGWAQVAADRWRFGVEIFARRLVAGNGQTILDEDCFGALMSEIWDASASTDFPALASRVAQSRCVQ